MSRTVPAAGVGTAGALRALLRLAGFRRLLTVRLLSQFGDGVFQVGLATYVVFSPEQQTSPGDIAAAMAVLLLPYSLLGPFAGVLLDRWRRRQVLLHGNLLRSLLALLTAALVMADVADWLFYLAALSVTAVNRFILAGLSAGLPRVVHREQLVVANSLSPTAGTLAATIGGGASFVVQLVARSQGAEDAAALVLSAAIYTVAGLSALTMAADLLGPAGDTSVPRLATAMADAARGLAAGLRHLAVRPLAARSLAGVAVMRFCYGALLVLVLMLTRYGWSEGDDDGMALLGLAVAVSGAGFFVAAVVTPPAVARWGALRWFSFCAGTATVLVPALGLTFSPVPIMVAAFVLGLVTQGAKIVTDTVVQSSVDDAYRGRVFSLYDMLYNVAFVAAAGLAALVLPYDGRSPTLVVTVTVLYAGTALLAHRLTSRAVSRETVTSGRTTTS
ncbi:MFS transporter [Streptomyces sp. RFCAC02]|uniref:MFS transporter n=1 Tax=Streptomyces sp. RFCAC02 TaxID=2499143 RepID=UPI00101F3F56|nr:MFS transporter [Streptomyces sp. RFCAC02]